MKSRFTGLLQRVKRQKGRYLHRVLSLNVQPDEHEETEIEYDEPLEEYPTASLIHRERVAKLQTDLAVAQKGLDELMQIQEENKILKAENEDLTRKNTALVNRAHALEDKLRDCRRENQQWREEVADLQQRDAGLCARVKIVHRKR